MRQNLNRSEAFRAWQIRIACARACPRWTPIVIVTHTDESSSFAGWFDAQMPRPANDATFITRLP